MIVLILSFQAIGSDVSLEPRALPTRSNGQVTFLNVSSNVGLEGIRGDNFCWGDYDNDGYEDLLVNWNNLNTQLPEYFTSRLFKNNGPPYWDFTEVTLSTGINKRGYCSWGDYDNDGYLDIYMGDNNDDSHDHLWHNNGDGTFTDVTGSAGGVTDPYPTLAVGWADYDNDGFLDIYALNWRDLDNVWYPDTLWHNNGDGTFSDVTISAGVDESGNPAAGMGFTWGDYNDDAWPDIYVGNYLLRANYLYENQKDGTFVDVGPDKGVEGHATRRGTDQYYGHSPGSAFADFDNDEVMDLWVSNLAHRDLYRANICDSSYFFHGNGPSSGYDFTDIFEDCGVPSQPAGGDEELYFGVAIADYDNDGFQDMFIPQVKNIDYAYSYLFRNDGDNSFTDVSQESGLRVWDTVGGAWCDYDQDGDLDLIAEGKYPYDGGSYGARLFQNQGTNGSWVGFDLEGREFNKAAIGARIKVSTSDGITRTRDVESAMGNHCYQNSLTQHFGLGDHSGTVDVSIRWGPYHTQELKNVQIGKVHKIVEPEWDVDLSIENIECPEKIVQGEILTIEAQIENLGTQPAKEFKVYLRKDHEIGREMGYGFNQELFFPGSRHTEVFSIDTSDLKGEQEFFVIVEGVDPEDNDVDNNIVQCSTTITVEVPEVNRAPVIEKFSSNRDVVDPGGSVNFFSEAYDPDGDALEFLFTCEKGDISSEGTTAVWTAPSEDGFYYVYLEVTDGQYSADSKINIRVEGVPNNPPEIFDIYVSPEQIVLKKDLFFVVTVDCYDPDGPSTIDRIEMDLSQLGSGTKTVKEHNSGLFEFEVALSQELAPGYYNITAVVFDEKGNSDTLDLMIELVEEQEEPVDNEDERTSIQDIDPVIILFIVAIIGTLIFAISVFFRRR